MERDEYQVLRREITRRHIQGTDQYFCGECGHPVYAPANRISGPYWQHFKGAPPTCQWWTGEPSSIDEISARKFSGRQESPLHYRLKYLIGELLELDHRVSDVVVDQLLPGINERRKPDIRAEFAGRSLAFELQLSSTQLPIIIERELFYQRERRHLIWVTWEFQPVSLEQIPQAFLDIRTAQNNNLFTMDSQTIELSRTHRALVLRALWWDKSGRKSKFVTLDSLTWPEVGLPYAVAPSLPWSEAFKIRWRGIDIEAVTFHRLRRELLSDLSIKLDLELIDLEYDDIPHLIDALISLQTGHPVGTRHENLLGAVNSFLSATSRHRYAQIWAYGLSASGKDFLLEKDWVKTKLNDALKVPQTGKGSIASKVVRCLFPEWVKHPPLRKSPIPRLEM